MDPKSKHSKRREDVLSTLTAVIDGLNVAGNVLDIMPAKAVFSTVSVILTMIRVSPHPLCKGPALADKMHTGLYDQPQGLRRPWIHL